MTKPFINLPGPAPTGVAVTKSDTVPISTTLGFRGIYCGVTGDITIQTPDGTTLLFKNFPQGNILPVETVFVMATGTTATNLVALV